MKSRPFLFGTLWQQEGDENDEGKYPGPWPVEVCFLAQDAHGGNGWGRREVEKHAKVLNSFLQSVGAGDESHAVFVEVQDEKSFVKLFGGFRFELCDEPPVPLYG